MPIGFAPDETTPVYLERTMHLPEAERPTFLCRFRSIKEDRQFTVMLDEARDAKTNEETEAAKTKLLLFSFSGSKNTAPFPDCLDDLSSVCRSQLIRSAFTAPSLSEAEKKTSPSLPESEPASSAATVPASA